MFEVGDFFEFYLKDAKTASDIMGLHLATRVINGEYVSMCGIPKHKAEEYMQKILDAGYNVALHGKEEQSGEIKTVRVMASEQPIEMVQTNIG